MQEFRIAYRGDTICLYIKNRKIESIFWKGENLQNARRNFPARKQSGAVWGKTLTRLRKSA
jgi:hypothetical protein